ncbi:MAG TPA: hypothetical protein VFS43_45110 [Polyangiaceae bacterium]|nr:hypothetical protein [Polyangiaceae bacterium]
MAAEGASGCPGGWGDPPGAASAGGVRGRPLARPSAHTSARRRRSLVVRRPALAAALLAAALYGSAMVATRLDLFSIDVAGHLASAMSFRRGYFHTFNDAAFLGYVQNLFYPPLEDALLGALLLAPVAPLVAYKAYLALAVGAYFAGVGALALRLRRPPSRALFVGASVLLFYAHKAEGFAQGLSFVDTVRVGVTSQCLGGAFYLALAAELYGRPRPRRLAALLSGLVLSHLIMGLAGLALVALSASRLRSRRLVTAFALAAGMSALFWVPFLAYRGLLVKNLVSVAETAAPAALACLPVAVLGPTPAARRLAAAVIALTLPSIVARAFEGAAWLPRLHYYRFDVCGLVLLPAAAAAALDGARFSGGLRRRAALACALAGVGWALARLPQRAGLTHPGRLTQGTDFERGAPPADERGFGRHLVVQYARSFDFAVENYLNVLDERARGAKGLFWESAEANHLVSSYVATLFGRPVILDHFFFSNFDCAFQQCVLDHFLADYNVEHLSVDERVLAAHGPAPRGPLGAVGSRTACYERAFADGHTPRFELVPEAPLRVNGAPFRVANVRRRPGGVEALNAAVELFPPAELRRFERRGPHFYNPYFHALGPACEQGDYARYALVEREAWAPLQAALDAAGVAPDAPPSPLDLVKTGPGSYLIELPAGRPSLFKVKLAWLPGFHLFDERGEEWPLYRGFPHMLALGEGTMRLEYRRPAPFWAGYALSAAAWVAFFAWGLYERTEARKRLAREGRS